MNVTLASYFMWCEALSVSEKIDVQLFQKFTMTQSTSEQWCEALSVAAKRDVQLFQKFTVTQSTSEQLLGHQACTPTAAPKINQS